MEITNPLQVLCVYRWPDRNTGRGTAEFKLLESGVSFDVEIEYFKRDEIWHIEVRPKTLGQQDLLPKNLWVSIFYGKNPDFMISGLMRLSLDADCLVSKFQGDDTLSLKEGYGTATIVLCNYSIKDFVESLSDS